MSFTRRVLAASALLCAASAAVLADDFDDLVKRIDPPKRFAGYEPKWSIEKKDYTFETFDGPVTVPHWLILDAGRCVAFMPRAQFHCGCIYVLDFRPGRAPKVEDVPMPTERWHIDTTIGAQLRTDAFIPTAVGGDDSTYDWKIDGPKVVLTRRFKGEAAFNKWTHRTKGKIKVDTTNRMILSVDPRLGYVVDTRYDSWTSQKLRGFEFASAAMSGRHTTWPADMTCYRMAITGTGDRGLYGYATNMGCTRQHERGGWCRNGGFVAFLNDKTGWSTTYTNETGVDSCLVVCGPHTDHDFTLQVDKIVREIKDGMDRYTVRHRMLAMPPEVTRHVWENMTLLHKDERGVLLRIGRLEDFEDQPLSLGGRDRGHPIGGAISTEQARSGKKSLRFSGAIGPGSPTLCVRPGRRYRLEAWYKVVDWTPEQRKAAEDALREKIKQAAEAAERAKQRGRQPGAVPAFKPLGPAEAGIRMAFQQWAGGKVAPERFEAKVGPSAEWQHLAIDFLAPKWGPALGIAFYATNCTVYMDDFRLAAVEEAAKAGK